MNIAVIIVTYNRKNDVVRCINAVLEQSVIVENIVVVNNASTDGTKELLESIDGITVLNLDHNTGGAGGFYTGLKYAYENFSSDYFWLMDDDGFPEQNCLELLLKEKSDYIMPVSLNIQNPVELSWPTRKTDGKKTILYSELKESWGKILDFVTPFNGVLLSKKCVETVGYINKDFFIWGDDYEHYYRCLQNGIHPVTLLDAKFFHPAQKVNMVKICFRLFSIAYSDSKLRMYCMIRNWTYIYRHYNQKYKIPIKWLMYFWLFHFTRHNDKEGWTLYKQSVKDGFREDFTRHLEYLGK